MISRMSYVRCDDCGDPAELGDNAREARAIARSAGWITSRLHKHQGDLCPKCWYAELDLTPPFPGAYRDPTRDDVARLNSEAVASWRV